KKVRVANGKARKSTRQTVAQLMKMEEVTTRSIAYICVLLRFSLSEAGSWNGDPLINYQGLYNAIVDYLKCYEPGSPAEARIKALYAWWNKQVFSDKDQSTSLTAFKKFNEDLAAQRTRDAAELAEASARLDERIAARQAAATSATSSDVESSVHPAASTSSTV
ncbi:hypothetical protein V5O48_018578, partial [Marasmius crinis-equi]